MALALVFSYSYFTTFGNVCLVGGDVSFDDECVFVNLKMMCRLSFSEVLIEVGCAYTHFLGFILGLSAVCVK